MSRLLPDDKATQLLLAACLSIVFIFCISLIVEFKTRPAKNAFLAFAKGEFDVAAQHLNQSAAKGDSSSLTSLANLYRLGLGVPVDYLRSAQLYEQAARSGDTAAKINLGHMYRLGLGVQKDGHLAYAWYNLARHEGEQSGQLYMSELLAELEVRGHYVPEIKKKFATLNNMPPVSEQLTEEQAARLTLP